LVADGTLEALQETLMPAQHALSNVEIHGIRVDMDYLQRLKVEYEPKMKEMGEELDRLAREVGFEYEGFMTAELKAKRNRFAREGLEWVEPKLNPNAWAQLQHVVYDLLKMPKYMGERTTSAEALEAYKSRHPFIQAVLDYRSTSKLWGTYIIGMEDRLGPDGRIHTDYLLHGTVTGRLSSANPNMQNIPRKSPIKRMFIPSEGYTFVEADYNALELRVAAWYSNDEKMLEYFDKGIDFHRRVGSAVFNKPEEEVTDHERFLTKFITFGLLYGRGAKSLADGELGGTYAAAERYIQRFFEEFPQLHAWVRKMEHDAVHDGVITTPFGRKRRWNFITPDIEWKIRKQAVNSPIQSMASDLCLSALTRLDDRLRREGLGFVLGTVHDSIMYEVRTEQLEVALPIIREEMEASPIPSSVKWQTDISYGPNWGETVKWK
jgi:DNA polymerase-1